MNLINRTDEFKKNFRDNINCIGNSWPDLRCYWLCTKLRGIQIADCICCIRDCIFYYRHRISKKYHRSGKIKKAPYCLQYGAFYFWNDLVVIGEINLGERRVIVRLCNNIFSSMLHQDR